MGMTIITGYTGEAHVTSEQARAENAGVIGTEKYVLNIGNTFDYEIITNNLVRISNGYGVNQGTSFCIVSGDSEDAVIDNGLIGVSRNDLIVARYEKSIETGVESVSLVVIKGTSSENPVDPAYQVGDIFNGAFVDDFPLWRVKITDLSITAVEQMFDITLNMQDIFTSLSGLVSDIDIINDTIDNFLDKTYPIGSIYLSINNVNPTTFFGGTWIAWGTGKTIVGVDSGDSNFNTVEKTGGESTHTLTVSEMPSHTHTPSPQVVSTTGPSNGFYYGSGIAAVPPFVATTSTGSDGAHNNLQPYITLYMWKRTA